MATVHIVLGVIETGSRADIPSSDPVGDETITSSGASQRTSLAAPGTGIGDGNLFWSITSVGGPVWVKFGATAVAAAGSDWLVADGHTREFLAKGGHKVAVINA